MSPRLTRLLNPASIAVIGGGDWCGNVIRQARAFGYAGPIWPVHRSKSHLAGLPAYPGIAALPSPPDAAFIGINRRATIDAVAALSAAGAGGAVCFASGYLEARDEAADGADLQADLIAAAGDMPILGPNCYGFINYLDGALLWPDQHGGEPVDSGVAIVTQSSNIAINITMQRRALPLAMIVTAGNQAQIGLADIGAYLLADPRITALGLHIEGIGDIRTLEALAATARDLGKPIVTLKVGRSAQARSAAISHTASLAGSNAGARALLDRLGIGQADSLGGFLEALKLLHVTGPLASKNLVSMSCSGGEASLVADLAAPCGVTFPPLDAGQRRGLRAALGPMVKLANPLDYHTYIWNDAGAMTRAFSAAMAPDTALGLIVADFPRADRCDTSAWDCVITAATDTGAATRQPLAVVSSLPENMPEDIAARLMQAGVAPLAGLSDALSAARIAADCARHPTAAPVLRPCAPENTSVLDEAQAKSALAAHGLRIPRAERCDDIAALAGLAASLTFPLVLKGEGHAHKTEAGAVALNLASPGAVTRAAAAAPATSYLLEEMITGGVTELLIGVVLDPAHGYVLTLGAGGTLSELIRDTASLIIPTDRPAIEAALSTLKIAPLLAGYRGAPAADIDAIIDAAMAIQAYVVANHGHVAEVEVNPLIALPIGAIAADALIRTGEKP
jgi:acyl-CoA synthetase (NDP forming)